MKSSRSFTIRAFKIIVFAVCSLVCCEFGHNSAFPTAAPVAGGNQLAQTDTLHLLRLPIRRQTSQMQSKQTGRFLNFKRKSCNGDICEFSFSCSYDSHCPHRNAQGTLCSDESRKSEITFAGRAGLTTCILRQHSLASAKLGESFTLHFCFTDIDQNTQINTIIIK